MLLPCGQCLPCRVNRRRVWSHRLMLEARVAPYASFVTLTYDDEHVPLLPSGLMTLRPRDLQLWLKRLRRVMEPQVLRFFGVGEYGDVSWRPHYHVALFNWKGCVLGDSRLASASLCGCASCRVLRGTWSAGRVHQGSLEVKSASYIAGYCVKKMTKVDDERLRGRVPEFARMSLRPGIGAFSVREIAKTVREYGLVEAEGDVPGALRHGASVLPLGRYLRRRLRRELGLDEGAPLSTIEAATASLRILREAATEVAVTPQGRVIERVNMKVYGNLVKSVAAGQVASLEARLAIRERGKK